MSPTSVNPLPADAPECSAAAKWLADHAQPADAAKLATTIAEVLAELTGPLAPPMRIIRASVEETDLDESDLHRGYAKVVRFHLQRI